jgi:DNA polymerase-3 subunit gamma/tau
MRYLLSHPESDCIFEVTSTRAAQQHCENGCEDVTGIGKYERLYQQSIAKGNKMASKNQTRERSRVNTQPVSPPDTNIKTVEPAVPDLSLPIKYRPKQLSEVVGQDAVIKSLQSALKKSTHSHAYLFTGPSGTGKTTLARILASTFSCEPANIIETDAATNTGIDAMRDITSTLRYQGFGDTPNKMIILDEAHMLSKAAWASLLKAVEEPPEHVYFCFCTTDGGKVPDAIRNRCSSYDLKPVRYDDIMDLLEMVAEQESMKMPDSFLQQVAKAAGGSPRQALVMLHMIDGCDDADEVSRLLEMPLENKEIIDLCRLLVSGNLDWKKVTDTLKALTDTNPESIRIVAVNYINACLIGAKSERDVPRLLDLLAAFSKPCNQSDKLAGILLAIGNTIFPV